MNIMNAHPSVSAAEIEQLARAHGISLPAEYLEFLVTSNGGKPVPSDFSFEARGELVEATVHYFLAIRDGTNGLAFYWENMRGRMPAELVPIASDPGGNLICLGVSGEVRGKVYFWDHELESDDEPPGWDNFSLIAGSFTEFLAGLQDLPDA
jgi:hypothetical protein